MSYLGPSLRRNRRRNRAWPRLALAVVISVLANAAMIDLARVGFHPRPVTITRPVAMAPLPASQWEANRAVRGAAPDRSRRPDPVAKAPEEPEEQRNPRGQVVDIAPSDDATPPKDSRFLAERNSTVEKETISRHRRPGYENVAPVPASPKEETKQEHAAAPSRGNAAQVRGSRGAGDARQERTGTQTDGDRARGARLALKLDRFGEIMPNDDRQQRSGTAGSPPPGDPTAPDEPSDGTGRGRAGPVDPTKLAPSASTYDRLAGGPAPDHVDGIEEGEGTYLNAREWKYASYFNRIKQAVASQWNPNRALSLRDPDGRRFAYRDRHTVLAVRLDGQGALKSVDVVKSSGVEFLDETAAEAFRRAQPFVNPPRGLADGHGEIVFTFGFYLETGGGFRMIRGAQ